MVSLIEHQRVSRRRRVPVKYRKDRTRFASPQIAVDRREVPLLLAAIVFAVLSQILLIPRSTVVFLRDIRDFSLPHTSSSIVEGTLFPENDSFAVIGEVASVDPSMFRSLEVGSYTVQSGDTLGAIASRFGLKLDTLISFNQIEDVRRLQIGDVYRIPNRDGLLYTVKSGDTLVEIAQRRGTTVNALLDANDLPSQNIAVGQVIFVPGARLNETELRLILGELFGWPTQGRFTSGFGMRDDPFTGLRRFHNGIDLANSAGTPIRAAASGQVVHIESQTGNYGKFIIIRHAEGFQTLYGHLSSFSVHNGQSISRGQIIGTMGSTGRSTGPHLHFSVIHNGTFVDPLRYLH